jgi:hypothetical protein
MREYIESTTRMMSLPEVQEWHQGESEELKKLMGFGFNNHLFISEKGAVTLYYDNNEGEKFHGALRNVLTENFFDSICDKFSEAMEEFSLIKAWPIFTIFDEIDNYPELATHNMLRRLMRLRTSTHEFFYNKEFRKKGGPKDFILFKGKVFVENEKNIFG